MAAPFFAAVSGRAEAGLEDACQEKVTLEDACREEVSPEELSLEVVSPKHAGSEKVSLDDASLENAGLTVGTITVDTSDVFEDDGETTKLVFRLADKLHVTTHDGVLRRQLVLRPGDPYSGARRRESERILRTNAYLYDAELRPVRVHDGVVDMVLKTRDVWTTRFGIGFGRAGGVNKTHLGIEDANFLGTGKQVALRRTSDVDRVETVIGYRDDGLFGSRYRTELAHASNSDGVRNAMRFERPFFSLDARWTAGVQASDDQRVDSLWSLGQVESSFGHHERDADLWAGWSKGLRGASALRWTAGFSLREDLFETLPAGGGPAPPDRRLAYPWIAVEHVRDGYVALQNLDKIHKTEDINLAPTWRARLGYASPAFGSDRAEAVLESGASGGRALGGGRMLLLDASATGRVGAQGPKNAVAEGGARYVVPDFKQHGNLVMWLRGTFAHDLDPENRLLLGGDTGLRGYPLRYAYGDRAGLIGIEQRLYGDRQWLHLLRVGAAAFAEMGYVSGGDAPANNLGVLRDVGLGLRLGSSRSSHGAMIHIDVAFPLDAAGDQRHPQFLVSTGDTF